MSEFKPDPSSWTVVVVDDDAHNLDILKKLFKHLQATVHLAQNGDDALKILETVTPTVVLMDLSMPGTDGWTAHKRIRSSRHKDTLVIAVSAHAMAGDEDRVMEAGFDGYLSKPIQVRSIVNQIGAFLLLKKEKMMSQAHHIVSGPSAGNSPATNDPR